MSPPRVIGLGILLISGLLMAEISAGGKGIVPFHQQGDISDNPNDCEKAKQGKQHRFVQGEVLVKFKDGVAQEGIEAIQEKYGLSLIKRLGSTGVYRFNIPPDSTVQEVVQALHSDPRVEYAEPNYIMSIDAQ
jgi:thermitase